MELLNVVGNEGVALSYCATEDIFRVTVTQMVEQLVQ